MRDQARARSCPPAGVERDTSRADRRTGGGVAWAIEDVVLAPVARDPRLDERVEHDEDDEHTDRDQRHENVERPRVVEPDELPARWNQAQRAIGETDVPVGLRT